MRVKKYTITDKQKKLWRGSLAEEYYADLYYPQETKEIRINLIEIKTDENPSEIILIIKNKQITSKLPIYLFKTELVFIRDVYCWHTKDKKEFILTPLDFSIEVEGNIKNYSIDFFYSTDQKEPYIFFERKW